MKLIRIYLFIFLLGVIIPISVYAVAASGNNSTTMNLSAISGMPHADLIAFVEEAVAYAHTNGKDRALKEFSNRNGSFVRGDLYIYAYDFQGTNIAHPFKPDWIGKNKLNVTDSNGIPYIKNLIKVAKEEKGFTYFIFPNPAHGNRDEFKIGYAMKVDDSWWLGSGIYLSNISANFSQGARNDLVSFVDSAVKYAKENGKDRALKDFNDKNGTFFKGGLYIFAYDFNGTTLALPTQPDLVGANRIDVADLNGVKFVRYMRDLAREGRGSAYYIYPDPTKNMTQRLKLSYVEKIDDNWWLGAGIYAQ
ncbi:MAG: cache domain-containing protein [Methanotrichaceae archaeon]